MRTSPCRAGRRAPGRRSSRRSSGAFCPPFLACPARRSLRALCPPFLGEQRFSFVPGPHVRSVPLRGTLSARRKPRRVQARTLEARGPVRHGNIPLRGARGRDCRWPDPVRPGTFLCEQRGAGRAEFPAGSIPLRGARGRGSAGGRRERGRRERGRRERGGESAGRRGPRRRSPAAAGTGSAGRGAPSIAPGAVAPRSRRSPRRWGRSRKAWWSGSPW